MTEEIALEAAAKLALSDNELFECIARQSELKNQPITPGVRAKLIQERRDGLAMLIAAFFESPQEEAVVDASTRAA